MYKCLNGQKGRTEVVRWYFLVIRIYCSRVNPSPEVEAGTVNLSIQCSYEYYTTGLEILPLCAARNTIEAPVLVTSSRVASLSQLCE